MNAELAGHRRILVRGFLTASRTEIQPPAKPGTEPSTRIRPRSTSVLHDPQVLRRDLSVPMWPGIFFFFQVLPGS